MNDDRSQYVTESAYIVHEREPLGAQIRDRKCLKCRQMFRSEWSGERVCKPCKSSSQWRIGLN